MEVLLINRKDYNNQNIQNNQVIVWKALCLGWKIVYQNTNWIGLEKQKLSIRYAMFYCELF